MSNPILKIITTADGSHSLHREDLNETYHSFHGARGESDHVFIKSGLDYWTEIHSDKPIKVFEVGLGTGLNALLSCIWASKNKVSIDYHSVEPIPVPSEIFQNLNYGEADPEESRIIQQIHQCEWGKPHSINEIFQFTKYQKTLETFDSSDTFDIIYFDAFAPSKQPDIWEIENIEKCYLLLRPQGILTTYCAQGQFKRNLKSAGFEVEILSGAMGKKEMVRAHKP